MSETFLGQSARLPHKGKTKRPRLRINRPQRGWAGEVRRCSAILFTPGYEPGRTATHLAVRS